MTLEQTFKRHVAAEVRRLNALRKRKEREEEQREEKSARTDGGSGRTHSCV